MLGHLDMLQGTTQAQGSRANPVKVRRRDKLANDFAKVGLYGESSGSAVADFTSQLHAASSPIQATALLKMWSPERGEHHLPRWD
mmetsp:Transcript_70694/g.132303  ORF Transcript_70694/g.132303 Transcript_70694/m.132303 type:complete len:85 (+) Transcript_70694:187-441(+)